MKKMLLLTVAALLAVAGSASAGVIGPWPTTSAYMWEDQPIPGYASGTGVSILAPDVLQLGNLASSGKETFWPPALVGTAGERLTAAQVILPAGTYLHYIHTKVYDPYTSGKNGWAVIIRDSAGRWLDFGIRPILATKAIRGRQHDEYGASVGEVGTGTRGSVNPSYYTMDFSQNVDGTISWTMVAWWSGVDQYTWTATSTQAYGNISEVYLTASTSDTSTNNYKYTEYYHWAVPEPGSLLALGSGLVGLAGFALRRRKL